jgi:hypothetical protein
MTTRPPSSPKAQPATTQPIKPHALKSFFGKMRADKTPPPQPQAVTPQPILPQAGKTQTEPVKTGAAANAPSGFPRTAGRSAILQRAGQQAAETGRATPPIKLPRLRKTRLRALPRPVRWVLQGTLALAFAGMLSLAVIFLMVQRGPISVGFLVGPIEDAIRRELGTGRVEIESALLRLSEDGRGIEFRLANLRIKDAHGAVLAETPLAGINLSGAALMRGWLAPVSVEFIRPTLRLTTTRGGGIALAVSRPPESGARTVPEPSVRPAPITAPSDAPRQIDLIAALQHTMTDFREGDAASVYLRELGLRDATLTIEHDGQEVVWHIPGFTIDVQHFQKRSVIVGEGLIGSPAGPWGLSFRTTDSRKSKRVRIEAEIAELVPRSIAANLAFLPGAGALDMPVGGSAAIDISAEGGIAAADLKLTLSPGRLQLPDALGGSVPVSGGALHLSYDAADRRLVVNPSELIWGKSRATWSGHLTPGAGENGPWHFDLATREANLEGLALTEAAVSGNIVPQSGQTRIEKLALRAGDAQLALSGGTIATPSGAGLQLDGHIRPLSLPSLLSAWPKHLAPELAQWIQTNVKKGRIAGGTVRLAPPPVIAERKGGAPAAAAGLLAGVALELDLQDLSLTPLAGFIPLVMDAARLRLEGGRLDIASNQARLPLPSGKQVALKDPRFSIAQLETTPAMAEVTLQSAGPASTILELLDQEPLGLLRSLGLDAHAIEGKSEATIKATFPTQSDLKTSDIKAEGRIRVTDTRSKGLLGGFDISGGTLLLGLTDKALDAKGDLLIAGVPAKLTWQRIFNAPADRQPPARLTATLDAADRDTLGLSVNHMVQGDVPVVVTLQQDAHGQTTTQIEANLGAAELLFDTMAWRKAPGRPALLQSNIVRTKDGRTELQNFKIIGDDISLDGTITLDAKNQMRAFNFPAFAVNVVTKLEMQGRVRDDGVLDVKAKGTAYDGRAFFRSLFSSGQITEKALPQAKHRPGLDLSVDIDTIIGFTDTNLKNVHFSLKRRGDKIISLQATGALSDSNVPVNAEIRVLNGTRLLQATSADAGSAFRMIGFYPNMRGGNGTLDVNLDGKGPAEKTGRLRASQFAILGDPVVSEVLQGSDEVRKGGRRVVRETVEFDHLDVPFSLGHGQVVLGESTINGPLLGARLNGKVDYNKQSVFLEGTYVPLYGLNSIPNSIPIIGEILSGGRTGDGLFGITFQVQGPMGRPQVLVNPLSMLTPGLFRQIWETNPQGQSVVPRAEVKPRLPAAQASSAEPQTGDAAVRPAGGLGKASSSGPQRVDPAPASAARPEATPRPAARERTPAKKQQEDGQ